MSWCRGLISAEYKAPEGSSYVGVSLGLAEKEALQLPEFKSVETDVTHIAGIQANYNQLKQRGHKEPSNYIKSLAHQAGHFPCWLKPQALGAYEGLRLRKRWVDAKFQHRANGFSKPKNRKQMNFPTKSSLIIKIRLEESHAQDKYSLTSSQVCPGVVACDEFGAPHLLATSTTGSKHGPIEDPTPVHHTGRYSLVRLVAMVCTHGLLCRCCPVWASSQRLQTIDEISRMPVGNDY